jgi:hypothetical protein
MPPERLELGRFQDSRHARRFDSPMGEGDGSNGVGGWVVGLLVAILLVVGYQALNQDSGQDAPRNPRPTQTEWEPNPQVQFACRDLQGQVDNAYDRAYAARNFEEQTRASNRIAELEHRYMEACDEYDIWLRTRG